MSPTQGFRFFLRYGTLKQFFHQPQHFPPTATHGKSCLLIASCIFRCDLRPEYGGDTKCIQVCDDNAQSEHQ